MLSPARLSPGQAYHGLLPLTPPTPSLLSPQGFVIELLLTLESGIDTLADTVKNYDLLTALAQYVPLLLMVFYINI